jgi:hypothetical protein
MSQILFNQLKKEVIEISDRNPCLSSDNAFITWFIEAYLGADENEAIKSIAGGSKDKGLDACFIDHEARMVFLLQGKYQQGASPLAERRADLIALANLGRTLLLDDSTKFQTHLVKLDVSAKLLLEKARELIQKRDYRLRLQFVSTGKISKTHLDDAEILIDDWENSSIETFSRVNLLNFMQDYIEGAAPPTPVIVLPIEENEAFSRYDKFTGITSWIFTMRGASIAKLFNNIGIRLFARNIRGFLGSTDVNKEMQLTLQEESQYFWYYNNGITIVCDEAREIKIRGRSHLKIINGQIINGQQTTRILSQNKDNDAEVLVRLVEIPRDKSESQEIYSHIINKIVAATNWQNAISQSDLKSNDVEQVRIEREFRKHNYQYLRKRMISSEARERYGERYRWIVRKDDLARAIAACMMDPYEVRLGKDRLFEDDAYYKIFDRRNISEYLLYFWLNRMVTYYARLDYRRGYAKYVVMNFIWAKLGQDLRRPYMRSRFIKACERENKYYRELQRIFSLIESTFILALAYYRAHKRRDGKLLDESTFFKHKNLHKEFEKYWDKQPKQKKILFRKRREKFIERLKGIEI